MVEAFPGIEITLHLHNTRGLGLRRIIGCCGIRRLDLDPVLVVVHMRQAQPAMSVLRTLSMH